MKYWLMKSEPDVYGNETLFDVEQTCINCAKKLGLTDGEEAIVESRRGKITVETKISEGVLFHPLTLHRSVVNFSNIPDKLQYYCRIIYVLATDILL